MYVMQYLCHSTCINLTQEYFVSCALWNTTKRPAGPAWSYRNLSSLGRSWERKSQSCMPRKSLRVRDCYLVHIKNISQNTTKEVFPVISKNILHSVCVCVRVCSYFDI